MARLKQELELKVTEQFILRRRHSDNLVDVERIREVYLNHFVTDMPSICGPNGLYMCCEEREGLTIGTLSHEMSLPDKWFRFSCQW